VHGGRSKAVGEHDLTRADDQAHAVRTSGRRRSTEASRDGERAPMGLARRMAEVLWFVT
jgi:hypothetical protein